MNCKRGVFSIGIIILFLIFVFFISLVSSVSDKDKIGREIYEKLEKSEEVRVVVSINIEKEKGIFIKQKKTEKEIISEKQEIKEEIIGNMGEENVKHIFDEEIAVEVSKDKLDELNNNPNVKSVIIDKPIHAFLQNSVPYINASLVWPIQISNMNITGIDETICILDTGINFSHPALIGKNKTCVIDCYNKACVENCSINDDNGHGTHVAGIVAASGSINGVAISANLIGVKVLDSSGSGAGTDLNAGINWCIANSAAYNISVISLSLGDCSNHSTYCNSDSSASFINNATAHNISVIAAAGNCNPTQCPGISCTAGPAAPACVQNATAVGAVNDADDSISYQRGVLFELLAPGININSTKGNSCLTGCSCSGNYMICSGTSMATPHVAGAFALFRQFFRLQNNRIPTPNEIKSILNNTGKQINDSSGTSLNYSIINIYSAVNFILKNVSVNLISPANNSFFNIASQNQSFNCNATSLNSDLTNVTFYLWNSSTLIYNLTQNISGTNNQTNFSYNFSIEDNYFWNCIAYNNDSFSNSNANYTINYDITKPNIFSISNDSISTTSAIISWTTNENANSSVDYGTTRDLGNITNNSSLATSHSFSLSSLSSSTVYYYNITSCDAANNCNTTGINSFTTLTPTPVSSSSSGGGGSSVAPAIYVATLEQASAGYNKSLKINDKIKFTFFDEKEGQHTLTVNNITGNSVSLTIQSSIIKLKLGIGQSAKLNLTSADYYNLYVKLNSIINKKADITIQTIHEQIPKPSITSNVVKEDEEKKIEEIPPKKQTNIRGYIKDILIVILIIAVLVILFSKKDRTKLKYMNQYKEKFKSLRGKNKNKI